MFFLEFILGFNWLCILSHNLDIFAMSNAGLGPGY